MAKVSIVIPVYNEEQFIQKTVEDVLSADTLDLPKEIIIVDDGSKDKTPRILSSISKKYKNINFLDWHRFEEIQDRDLIISTTPAGATDGLSIISTKADFFEVIYHPWPTELAKRYQNLGRNVIGGLSLLVEQALFQINYFAQKEFDFDQMRQELLKVGHAEIKK